MERICNIIYQENEVIFGNMTFKDDGVVIHNIIKIIEKDTTEEALALGEKLIKEGTYSAYIVPSLFKGDIICEYNNY